MKKIIIILTTTLFILLFSLFLHLDIVGKPDESLQTSPTKNELLVLPTVSTPTPTPALKPPPDSKILDSVYHVFQTFNNCGPASLSMALSYYDIAISQQVLGQELRPFQVPGGDNDDKSVTLKEIAKKGEEYGFTAYHRPNGNIDLIKKFITYDIPVITRTLTKPNEDIGHYRVIKGYDSLTNEIIQDDSLQGANLKYSFDAFNTLWSRFNYEYLILVPPDKSEIVKQILTDDLDPIISWTRAANYSKSRLAIDPNDIYTRFNLSVALYNTGDWAGSIEAFEQVDKQLPFRTLWYQTEPIEAYFQLGNYERVFEITDSIVNNHNRAFSELYILRGKIYKSQGKDNLARQEFKKAVFYNTNLAEAQLLLESIVD